MGKESAQLCYTVKMRLVVIDTGLRWVLEKEQETRARNIQNETVWALARRTDAMFRTEYHQSVCSRLFSGPSTANIVLSTVWSGGRNAVILLPGQVKMLKSWYWSHIHNVHL
jgi:hypothetical protein